MEYLPFLINKCPLPVTSLPSNAYAHLITALGFTGVPLLTHIRIANARPGLP